MSRIAWVGLLAGAAATLGACGVSPEQAAELHRQVKSRGLIVGFEGLQPWSGTRAGDLVAQVARASDLAPLTLSGNVDAAMPFITEANTNRQRIYVLGYSLGGNDARDLTIKCKAAGIPIDGLFLVEPGSFGFFTGKIPDNVRKVVFYMSGDCTLPQAVGDYPDDPRKTRVKLETLADVHHLELPAHVARYIRNEIRGR